MENKITGAEFGLFDYTDIDQEEREEKWRAISYIIESGKVQQEDVAMLFQNNPFFFATSFAILKSQIDNLAKIV